MDDVKGRLTKSRDLRSKGYFNVEIRVSLHQVSQGYKCGVCGDPYDGARLNEEGGLYATGLISGSYLQGQVVTIQVEITANHKGYFEFRICPKSSIGEKTTQECLDRYLLALADGSGTKYRLASDAIGMINIPVLLPPVLTCDYCVLQWRYHTGNSWGVDPDGTQCVGCGPQEEFYGCADVSVVNQGGVSTSTNTITSSTTAAPTTTKTTANTTTTTTTTSKTTTCKAAGAYVGVPGMDSCLDLLLLLIRLFVYVA
ncbi:hypothetical protein Btru_023560 [Bulinus truncatus]|nr:hypothetical protein Btru_023560 [Bulinus truncatus]